MYKSHPGQLNLAISLWGGRMSTKQAQHAMQRLCSRGLSA